MASLPHLCARSLLRSAAGLSRGVSVSPRRGVVEIASGREFRRKVLESKVPVVVDFHAGWCGPCHSLDTVLRKVLGGREEEVELVKVDVEQAPQLATEYGVTALPTVMGVRGGKVVTQFVGLQDELFVTKFTNQLVGGGGGGGGGTE